MPLSRYEKIKKRVHCETFSIKINHRKGCGNLNVVFTANVPLKTKLKLPRTISLFFTGIVLAMTSLFLLKVFELHDPIILQVYELNICGLVIQLSADKTLIRKIFEDPVPGYHHSACDAGKCCQTHLFHPPAGYCLQRTGCP